MSFEIRAESLEHAPPVWRIWATLVTLTQRSSLGFQSRCKLETGPVQTHRVFNLQEHQLLSLNLSSASNLIMIFSLETGTPIMGHHSCRTACHLLAIFLTMVSSHLILNPELIPAFQESHFRASHGKSKP